MQHTLHHLNSIHSTFLQDKLYSATALPGTKRPGFSSVYRNSSHPDSLVSHIPGLNTLHDLFQNAVELFGNDNCLGERLTGNDGQLNDYYTFQSYNKINQRRLNFASGLIQFVTTTPGFHNSKHTSLSSGKLNFVVSVSGHNSVEMLLLDLATRSFSLPNCGLYESLSKSNCKYILEVTESPVLVLNVHLVEKFLKIKEECELESLVAFVCFESLKDKAGRALIDRAQKAGVTMVDFQSLELLGKSKPLPENYNLPTPETLYTLAFTSGTTGLPKGVYLTHAVATANVTGFFIHCPKPAVGLTEEQMHDFRYNKDSKGRQLQTMCFLPLLHNYEKSISNFELSYGIALALPSKPGMLSLFEDVRIVKPSLFNGVPRIFTLVENAIKKELAKYPTNDPMRNIKVKMALGFENVSFLQCASAPISKESILFLKDVLQCGFLNSYGATELFSVISYSNPYETIAGSSGPVAINSELKLKDVAEMGYTSNDKPFPRGEVLIRGASQFSHYFQNEKATYEAIDSEGWYHTGDIASLDPQGNLFIVDRVKNFFKMSQGEYVTPEKIETLYLSKNPILTQLFVHGDSYQNYLIGIAGVDLVNMKKYLANELQSEFINDLSDRDLLTFVNLTKIKQLIVSGLLNNLKDCQLQGFEKLHNLHFEVHPLSVENETLTPSFKLKRNTAKVVHSEKIKQLYQEGSLIKPNKL